MHKAIAEGIIPFTLQGKKKLIDLDNKSVQSYIKDNTRQREAAKKNDIQPSKLPEQKLNKQGKTSEILENNNIKSGITANDNDLSAHEIKQRSQLADMHKKELHVKILQKKYLPIEFVDGIYITYLERLNSTIERFAATYIKDVGKKIIESGEVLPEHTEYFLQKILETIHNNKKAVQREVKTYEPKL